MHSLPAPIGSEHRVTTEVLGHGLGSYANEVLNRIHVELMSFGKDRLGPTFEYNERDSHYNELNLILAGQGRLRHGTREYLLRPGQTFLFPAGADLHA
jgi:mannose-6-phosphate isomerase-like protein (cupin superfamily)